MRLFTANSSWRSRLGPSRAIILVWAWGGPRQVSATGQEGECRQPTSITYCCTLLYTAVHLSSIDRCFTKTSEAGRNSQHIGYWILETGAHLTRNMNMKQCTRSFTEKLQDRPNPQHTEVVYLYVRRCVSHLPLPLLHARYTWYISTAAGIVSVPKRSTLETSRPEFSEHVSFGIDTLFACRAIELGKPPQGDVTSTAVVYG